MKKYQVIEKDGYCLVLNEGGKTLGYSLDSGVKLLEADGWAFKDLNRNGKLDPYEDWRLPMEERARDLAAQLTVEDIAGLMLYSVHQSIMPPDMNDPFTARFAGTYGGKKFAESDAKISDLTDQQLHFLKEDHLRHVLLTTVQSPQDAARWNNNAQAYVEGLDFGIPINNSSDPRHSAVSNGEYLVGADGQISQWPSALGMAATFDPKLQEQFGQIAAKEYRALGIATALSPQIDLATEPRWVRNSGTFGEGVKLAVDMARAYCDGFQTSEGEQELEDGWGMESVNAMAKHWPGGGTGEAGRDAHYGYGKFAVYPGKNFHEHLRPFTEGAFQLNGGTKQAAAIMPYYTISYDQDKVYGENVGNGFSKYIVGDLLREQYGYDSVVCTDWLITGDCNSLDAFQGKCWGTEHLNIAERHYKSLMAGIDQFGGNNQMGPIVAAYHMGVASRGEEFMRARFEQSAVRLLRNIFRTGLFENPYLDPEESDKIVGNPDFMAAGYEAQKKSVVMLKNHNSVLPLQRVKVYVPKKREMLNHIMGNITAETGTDPVPAELLSKYFDVVTDPSDADAAIVFMDAPVSGGYDAAQGGYLPISLQYGPYQADTAREVSLAGGDPITRDANRSYRGKENKAINSHVLDDFLSAREAMGDKPVIACLLCQGPMVVSEFEDKADAILVGYDIQLQALLDVISGRAEPSGLLPMQMPADMRTVEEQFEDVARDMRCHVDVDGNCYDYAFGLNWSGVIDDERVKKYR